jgi:hypothetical protein
MDRDWINAAARIALACTSTSVILNRDDVVRTAAYSGTELAGHFGALFACASVLPHISYETGCSSLRPSRNRPHSSRTIGSSNPTACPSSGRDVDRSRARVVGTWSGYGMGGAGSAWGIELRNS